MLISRTDRNFRENSILKKLVISFFVFVILFFILRPFLQAPLLNTFEYISNFLNNSRISELEKENSDLKIKLAQAEIIIKDSSSSELLVKMGMTDFVEASVIVRSFLSVYDTLFLNKGSVDGVSDGALVFTAGLHPVATVKEIDKSFSRIDLFTKSGNKISGVVKSASSSEEVLELTGDGAYGFVSTVPLSSNIEEGQKVYFGENTDFVVADVVSVFKNENENNKIVRLRGYFSPSGVSSVYIQK